jgi:N-methylhydantoinase B/oxoprolinase/acetone carboxylase alpha subunit
VSARETALNISASPIVRELGELCFALYTPEGDSVALSTGIIVHVHTMSDAIKYMVRSDYETNPGIGRATSSPTTTRRSATSTTPTSRPSCRSSGRAN